MALQNGKQSPSTPQETLQNLREHIDARFEKLKTLILWLHKQQGEHTCHSVVGKEGRGKDRIDELAESLHRSVDCFRSVMRQFLDSQSTRDVPSVRDLTRSLLVSGNGSGLEIAVEAVIRNYCQAREDVRRYARNRELSRKLREDIVAGFSRVLEHHRLELELIGVGMEEVEPGSPLDAALHDVVRKQPRSAAEPPMVLECISPIFRWKTGEGVARLKPARVIASVPRQRGGSAAPGSCPVAASSGKSGNDKY